jgi:cytochrome c1
MNHHKALFSTLVAGALLAGSSTQLPAAEDLSKKEPKAIKDVMEWTHKGRESLVAKVRDGKGTAEEIDLLVRYYKFMATQKPPQGDEAGWKAKTAALVAAAEKLKQQESGAADLYKTAVNCKACHDAHRPPE